jgi:hypothetical protein
MKAIKITEIKVLSGYILELTFSDNCTKRYDFEQLIEFKGIASALKDKNYFKKVEIINNGRAFAWQNGYDCCADWARYYAADLEGTYKKFPSSATLSQRKELEVESLA